MNQHINALLGPLEAATRHGSWEDAEDIACEISRLARLERLSELQRIQEALHAGWKHQVGLIAPRGSQVAKTPIPVATVAPIKQGGSTLILSSLTTPQPSWDEQWPFG